MPEFPVTNGVETFSKPPDGYVVDFDHPKQHLVLEHYLAFGIGGPLAFVTLLQRFYTKIWLANGFQMDDTLMFLSWVASIITQAMLVDSIAAGGMCAHGWEMPLPRFEAYVFATYLAGPMFMMCNGFAKMSLLTMYLQLSPHKPFRTAVLASIIFVAVCTATISFTLFVHCAPIRKAYDLRTDGGTCLDADILYMAISAVNVITDVLLFVLPIPMIRSLRMGFAQKLGAMGMFAVGSITLATSVTKLILLPQLLRSNDPSWDSAPANVWSFVEANLFIVCGSMPTLRKFFQHLMPKIRHQKPHSLNSSYLIYLSDSSGRSRTTKNGDIDALTSQQMYHEQLASERRLDQSLLMSKDFNTVPESPIIEVTEARLSRITPASWV
ncbi:Satratoxin biosynthesis SC1 cluster protein 4 [Colletotrichum trifolii]|uniref:Satratoxin biosynthesis SC1 cluster protein 4 n=1 Tax=Colletotrichum trifolii TaxID=5466 RepID=A0A4R8QS97_COLTR|nr:Satratoxin biosynthesis SC1 cluster protein 4 [Colletotrichum trifolii]